MKKTPLITGFALFLREVGGFHVFTHVVKGEFRELAG